MASTKALTLTTTPQAVIVVNACKRVIIKEDESVAGWPNVNLIIQKPDASGAQNVITAGKIYEFVAPDRSFFPRGANLGLVFLPSGTTSGIQDEM